MTSIQCASDAGTSLACFRGGNSDAQGDGNLEVDQLCATYSATINEIHGGDSETSLLKTLGNTRVQGAQWWLSSTGWGRQLGDAATELNSLIAVETRERHRGKEQIVTSNLQRKDGNNGNNYYNRKKKQFLI